ncbi:uncharacterized protein LOC133533523 [Cydia pomonella]|uniref:uncharacterized protein LOC133530129 n=1 Tax=Cydia pomonella TaxID=82600 RepID=UPI002ADE0E36|nr:uncharacterized protein LOC133530129 [Cydia pomonella]XP_061728491.1 uncharacterized protein LOC133533523 [Cydia pomonella]
MPRIATYVFFDLETTGLPHLEKNRTKIIELCFVATSRKEIERCGYREIPPVSKITLVFNPQRPMQSKVVELTGFTNKLLEHAPTFKQKTKSLVAFLEELEKPVCLVAHNGNIFDYKLLQTEFNEAGEILPRDLLCVDSIIGFRKLLKGTTIDYKTLEMSPQKVEELITDDEDEWPDINVSNEDWQEIDDICLSLSDMSCEDIDENAKEEKVTKTRIESMRKKKTEAIKRVMDKKPNPNKESFALTALYKRLLNREELNAHRAEADCFMLLYCVVAMKNDFLPWADDSCKKLTEIRPLDRH